jgi:hypothetical protein
MSTIMKKTTTRFIFSFVIALAIFLAARSASAAPVITSLGIKAHGEIAAVEGASPSDAERSGTLFLAWCEASPDSVVLAEVSIDSQRILRRKVVRQRGASHVALGRSGARVILAIGSDASVEVLAFDKQLGEEASIKLREGSWPSLVANDSTIALATYETREPIIARRATRDRAAWAPEHVLHVRVLDPSTLAIKNARVFEGKELLRPHFMGKLEPHVLALHGGRLYVALADVDPTIVALGLPSLKTEAERVLRMAERGFFRSTSASIVSANGKLVVGVLHGDVHVLTPSLDPILRVRPGANRLFAVDAKTGALFGGHHPTNVKRIGELPLHTIDVAVDDDYDQTTSLWAFGRPVLIMADPSAIVIGR